MSYHFFYVAMSSV